ncbi:hypothetical protein Tco_0523319 [Tanacetum coccineum]
MTPLSLRSDYSLVDIMETRFRDTERRMITALEMVNIRVSYQVDVRSRETEIEVLRRERLAYEQEVLRPVRRLLGSEAHCRSPPLESQFTVLETEVQSPQVAASRPANGSCSSVYQRTHAWRQSTR